MLRVRAPHVAFLAQMCAFACNAYAHIHWRNLPQAGVERGPIALKSVALPISKNIQLGRHRLGLETGAVPDGGMSPAIPLDFGGVLAKKWVFKMPPFLAIRGWGCLNYR